MKEDQFQQKKNASVQAPMPTFVTRPFLPPLEEFEVYLRQIWDSGILTNNGPFHRRLEQELSEFLGVNHLSLFSNGTLALITALQALRITDEVITTPFSFVATTHSLWWNGIKPVFVDIDPVTFNLDPAKIEAAITPHTTAIMPVHVYGNPCDTEAIQKVADTYGLRVIYDAAHAFGVESQGRSILHAGDMSILSFHATKVYTTFEGGAIVCQDEKTKKRIDYLKNFGFADELTVVGPGINAKMNEVQAAMGLLQLKYVASAIAKRKEVADRYHTGLGGIEGLSLPVFDERVKPPYSYYPILIDEDTYGRSRDALYEELKKRSIFSRRYFYPLISQFPTYSGLPSAQKGLLPVAERVSSQVLCLPIFPDLESRIVDEICAVLHHT